MGAPRNHITERNLRRCTSRKRDNIVLIDVDSDDFGDVIILDVPESFKKKFRKVPKNVISIDDDDDVGQSIDGDRPTDNGASASNGCCAPEAGHPSTAACAADVFLFANEENTPVKLFKSKRTYSGQGISRNRYGLSLDSDGCSSESDCSDCELVDGPSGNLREQWEKASYRKRNECSGVPSEFDDEAQTSAPSHNFDSINAEDLTDDPQPLDEQYNMINSSIDHNDGECAGSSEGSSVGIEDSEKIEEHTEMDEGITSTRNHALQDSPVHLAGEECTAHTSGHVDDLGDSAGNFAEQVEVPHLNLDAKVTNEVMGRDYFAEVTKGPSKDGENVQAAWCDSQKSSGIPNQKSSCGYRIEAVSSSEQNSLITDRQKIKETEEYKHAMEEEWAARQQQLLREAEEARRLRNRKKAENMRIMMNERRQKERLEEIRQTRIRDEENLNIKEKYRAEIRKELHRIEAMCYDMASLLRCLGIHVSGGPIPSPNEVQAAYKRACLKFHPDRISASDLRQQVEAEEKFKLISNMKDKFLFYR